MTQKRSARIALRRRREGSPMNKGWIRHLDFILVDLISLLTAYGVAFLLFRGNQEIVHLADGEKLFIFVLLHLIVVFLTEAYKDVVVRGYYREFMAALKQAFLTDVCFAVYYVSANKGNNIRLWPVEIFSLIWLILMYFARIIWKMYLRKRYANLKTTRQVLVVTTKVEALKMLPGLMSDSIRGYGTSALVIVDEEMCGQMLGGLEVKADRENLLDYAEHEVVDEALLNLPHDRDYELELANELLVMGITVHIYAQQQYEKLPNRQAGKIFGYDVLTSTISKITFRQMLLKRLMDIAGGIAGLIICVVVGIFIAPAICIMSPGGFLFSQIRVGKGGRKFRLYKFRSMYLNAEERKKDLMEQNEISGPMFKMKNDPRIIKGIGTFIRRTSLDEFPQFWNVLKGDMSLVGTRPPTVDEYERYSAHHRGRLSIKPGITGLWQISGRNDIMDFEEVVKLDVEYITHYSLELDIKILVKTVLAAFGRKGAA